MWTEKRQSEGQGKKGKRGAFVAPPSLREFPTGAVLSGACDVTKGVPQPEVDSRVNATCCSKDASEVMVFTPGEGLKKAGIGKDEQLSSVADNNASSVTCIPNSCFYPGGRGGLARAGGGVLDLPKNTNSDKAQYFTKLGKLLFHSLIFIKFAISLNAKI